MPGWVAACIIVAYFAIVLAVVPVLSKTLLKFPTEWVRKFQHIGFASSIFLFLKLFDTWYEPLIVLLSFMLVIFFALWLFERSRYYKIYFVDRYERGGELKYSLLMALGMFIILIFFYGWLLPFSNDELVATAVMSWGVGDALAALIGKRFGKRKLIGKGVDRKKTWVGTNSMTISVFIVAFLMILFHIEAPWWIALVTASIVGPVAATIEAYMKKGIDTIVLPIGIATTIYVILLLFRLIGFGVI